ncbi:MAG: methylglyoxal synthase [Chitinophagaceae bacterium]
MQKKRITLVAHDHKKPEMLLLAEKNKHILKNFELCATGITGKLINEKVGLELYFYMSGPLGGDFQIGTEIIEKKIDAIIFLWDPLEAQPHDPDVKALLRIAVLYNIPTTCNVATAQIILDQFSLEKE